MANPGGNRREGWRENEDEEAASRKRELESFDAEGQAPNPSSNVTQPSPSVSPGPRLVKKSERTPLIGADYTRSPFGENDTEGIDTLMGGREYGEPRPERNYPHAYNDDELQNTDLNPMMEAPRRPGGTLSILVLFAGALIMLVLIALMFFQFAVPSPRAP
jgi:hypothetical protein